MYHRKLLLVVLSAITALLITISVIYAANNNVEHHDEVNIQSIAPITSTLSSNRYTQMDDLTPVTENPFVKLDGHELLGVEPSSGLALYVNKTYLSIRIYDNQGNYIWGSTPNYDYLHPDHELYDPTDIGSQRYVEGSTFDEETSVFVREDRSPVSITYYNLNSNNPTVRNTEYFFENTVDGDILGYTEYNDKVGFEATLVMPQSRIRLKLMVYLDADGLVVEVPFESVSDRNQFVISTLNVYRLFGFTKDDAIPGYAFIPDGVGALMRFSDKTIGQFSKRFYGFDYTLGEEDFEMPLTARVFGMVHGVNSHAMLGIIEKGTGNAYLTYSPADNAQSDLNRMQINFEYRTSYVQRLNASGTSSVSRVQENMNPFDIKVKYIFLNGHDANYVGMANRYREYLIDQGYNFERLEEVSSIPLHLDVLATENKKVWYGQEVFSMTTVNQLKAILEDLHQVVSHMDVSIHGFQRGGMSNTQPNYDQIEGKFGDPKVLSSLSFADIYYSVSPLFASKTQGGYSSSQVIQTIGGELLAGGSNFMLSAQSALNLIKEDYNSLKSKGVNALAFPDLSYVFSDYANGYTSRSQVTETLRQFLDVSEKVMAGFAFDYMWDADLLNDIALYSSQQLKFTDTVPFIPIVLSGYQKVYGRSGNFFSNTSNELLRMVDYHILPSFYITHEASYLLLDTTSNGIFTSRYSDWESEIKRQYNYINGALKDIYHMSYTERFVLQPGVIRNTFSDGLKTIKVYINYSGQTVIHDGITLSPLSYEVVQ
ncbi:MAG TPA: DUF5696 domain-containing protein [Acholeplasma sp.]